MFRALDENQESVYANQATAGTSYFCPVCGGELTLKAGPVRVAHFAHQIRNACPYKEDGNNMSEWHARMQSYFPIECREVYFKEDETGEIHRADVFLKESNTVIEFQKSHMDPDEFYARTMFYLNRGFRIAWVFDESRAKAQSGDLGKFRHLESREREFGYPHGELCFKWLYHRECLPGAGGPLDIKLGNPLPNYAVFAYTGSEEADYVTRIVHEQDDYGTVVLSVVKLPMSEGMDPDILFKDEEFLIANSDWREPVGRYRAERQFYIDYLTRRTTKPTQPSNPIGRQMAGPFPRKAPIRRRRRGRF